MVSEMDDYLFDLRGYIVLKQAVSEEDVAQLNACVDRLIEDEEQKRFAEYEQFGQLLLLQLLEVSLFQFF